MKGIALRKALKEVSNRKSLTCPRFAMQCEAGGGKKVSFNEALRGRGGDALHQLLSGSTNIFGAKKGKHPLKEGGKLKSKHKWKRGFLSLRLALAFDRLFRRGKQLSPSTEF